MKRAKRIAPPAEGGFNIRLGLGREDGFVKIGPAWDEPDHVVDVKRPPWPVAPGVVDLIVAPYHFHRLTLPERHAFMEECWRVLKPEGEVRLQMPYYTSQRAISDPLAHWPPVNEAHFEFYRKAWREAERMQHDLPLKCDFSATFGYDPQGDVIVGRNEEFVRERMTHAWNVVATLHAVLRKNR